MKLQNLEDNVGEQFYNLEIEKANFRSLISKPKKIIKEIDVFGFMKTGVSIHPKN